MLRLPRLLLLLLVPFLLGKGEFPVGTAVTLVSIPGPAVQIDPRLLGRWRTPAGDGRWAPATLELRRLEPLLDRYEVEMPWYFARPVEGRLIRLKDNGEWTVLECSIRVRAEDTGLLLPAKHHFGIRLDGDRLVVSLLSVQLGYMAMTSRVHSSGPRVRDLETTFGGPVAVIVTDGTDLDKQLALAARRMLPHWVLTFERER
jgi:hypothetical protein